MTRTGTSFASAHSRVHKCSSTAGGAVNAGGVLPEHWVGAIVTAIEAGLDIASGMHVRLEDVAEVAEAADRSGRTLHNLRHPKRSFATGKGTPRTGMRLLTVGTDCSVGKKYAALCLERDMRAAGFNVEFCATGQCLCPSKADCSGAAPGGASPVWEDQALYQKGD